MRLHWHSTSPKFEKMTTAKNERMGLGLLDGGGILSVGRCQGASLPVFTSEELLLDAG